MQIVIDIPEEEYEAVKLHSGCFNFAHAILNGTLIPKGHGRLGDLDAFQKYCFNKNFDGRLSDTGLYFINLFLSFAPTVIEADKESEET